MKSKSKCTNQTNTGNKHIC